MRGGIAFDVTVVRHHEYFKHRKADSTQHFESWLRTAPTAAAERPPIRAASTESILFPGGSGAVATIGWRAGIGARHARVLSTEEDLARDEALREEISRRRSNGETVVQLAKRFHSTKGRISRILAQQRLKQVQELELDYIPNEHFSRTSAAEERLILGPAPENRQPAKKVPRPTGLPPYLASMYETPLLDAGTGAAPVPQDELLEAQGQRAPQALGRSPSQHDGDGTDREVRTTMRSPSRTTSSAPICGWWCRSPSAMPAVRATFSN